MGMIQVRVDERVRARATEALAAMGLTVADAVRVLLIRVATERALPFEVRAPNVGPRPVGPRKRPEDLTRLDVEGALQAADDNKTHAARALGVSLNTLKKKMFEFGFWKPKGGWVVGARKATGAARRRRGALP